MESGARAEHPSERFARLSRSDREVEFARVLAFSDGVFAIAITLLVLQLEVPGDTKDLGAALRDQLPDLFAFALSFAVLGKIWWSFHHRLFGGLEQFDGPLIALNFVYLALAVIVPFSSELIGDYGDDVAAVIAYAGNIALLSLVGAVMVEYAFRRGLMRPESERTRELSTGPANFVIVAVFAASIPVALLVGPSAATLIWLAAFFTGAGARRLSRRRRATG